MLRHRVPNSVDKIVQGNTSNIVFLKSTDDSMLDTLQKMSGTTHKVYRESKTVTEDKSQIFMKNDSKVTYTLSDKEIPVISYNDMAFIAERNSIVFRAGDSPVWNRNEFILPMSWRLFSNTIQHAGHNYTLQTIPTLSSVLDFDVRKNQPNFMEMLDKRRSQAILAETAAEAYQRAYGYSDYQIEQLDPDVYADDVMEIINTYRRRMENMDDENLDDDYDDYSSDWMQNVQDNEEQLAANAEAERQYASANEKRYAGKNLSTDDLVSMTSGVNHSLDKIIIETYIAERHYFEKDTQNFLRQPNGDLCGTDGTPYIIKAASSETLTELQKAAKEPNNRVFSEGDVKEGDLSNLASYTVTDAFYRFLVSKPNWNDLAQGRFEATMARKVME